MSPDNKEVISFGSDAPVNEGHPQTVALALSPSKHMPIDAMGYPLGKSSTYTAKAIPFPPGLSREEWLTSLEVATEYFRQTAGLVPPTKEALRAMSDMEPRVWDILYDNGQAQRSFESALALKGILKRGSGLTYDQLRALRYLTDVTVRGTLETRLKHLGVTWERFQNWQRDARFNEQFKALSEEILDQAQPLVMVELARNSVRGNLEAIKYFHQVTGRYDGAVSAADLQAFLNGLVEILQLEVADLGTLKRIGLKLAKLRRETLTDSRGTSSG
jgi:hypothetical protein